MKTPIASYIDEATGIEVKVYPEQKRPRRMSRKTRKAPKIPTFRQTLNMNGYDAAVLGAMCAEEDQAD